MQAKKVTLGKWTQIDSDSDDRTLTTRLQKLVEAKLDALIQLVLLQKLKEQKLNASMSGEDFHLN